MPLSTPVVFMIFNRPEMTAQVFAEIARAQPRTLLIVGDGPRAGYAGDSDLCARTRAVIDRIDWECRIHHNFAETNLGLKRRISSGLRWAFEIIEEGIILEDDCLPHPSFFRFCEELLERYRGDPRIMHISGDNFQFGKHPITTSYYFSRYPHIWGWATWRRAWEHYDVDLAAWSMASDRDRYVNSIKDPSERAFWCRCWDSVTQGTVDTWDYQWVFACFAARGLCVLPADNLVSNLGFGSQGTHTLDQASPFDRMPTHPMRFPLTHPGTVERDAEADAYTASLFFSGSPPATPHSPARNLVRKLLSGIRGLAAR
jgi:hypothetical protein